MLLPVTLDLIWAIRQVLANPNIPCRLESCTHCTVQHSMPDRLA